jgi:hypothetical protein
MQEIYKDYFKNHSYGLEISQKELKTYYKDLKKRIWEYFQNQNLKVLEV